MQNTGGVELRDGTSFFQTRGFIEVINGRLGRRPNEEREKPLFEVGRKNAKEQNRRMRYRNVLL